MTSLDTLSLLYQEIRAIPLLSRAEEIACAALLAIGRAAAMRMRQGEDTPVLRHQVLAGLEARNRLIAGNLRLVVRIAAGYRERGLELLDLIQEGSLGLMRAALMFDPTRGIPFAHYAAWWIRAALTQLHARSSRSLRLSVWSHRALGQLRHAYAGLEQHLGRMPNTMEIAEATGWTPARVRRIAALIQPALSLEQQTTRVAAQTSSPEQQVLDRLEQNDMMQALITLPERHQTVLALRYGFSSERRATLGEIGAQFGMTREGVRQIETKALRRLQAQLEYRAAP